VQIDFTEKILSGCHSAYIHTAIETCGNVPWENFQRILPFTDWIFFDLKHFDSQEHKKATTAGNSMILENAKRLSEKFTGRLLFRLPLIPGFNDSNENIGSLIAFIKDTGRNEINILPLHHLGREKYQLLGKNYTGGDYPVPANENLREIKKKFSAAQINCFIGSDTPF
jgi:pyruvate formate lyase activating enzyme